MNNSKIVLAEEDEDVDEFIRDDDDEQQDEQMFYDFDDNDDTKQWHHDDHGHHHHDSFIRREMELQLEDSENDKNDDDHTAIPFEIDEEISDDRLAAMYNVQQFSDSVFHLVHKHRFIHVSRAIIAAQSPLLRNLFHVQELIGGDGSGSGDNGDGEQRYTREYKNMVQVDSDEDAFEAMVKYMYTGRLQCMNKDLLPLLKLTRQFRVDRLNTHCMGTLSREVSIDNCLDVYLFCEIEYSSQQHELLDLDNDLRKKCLSFMTRNFEQLIRTESFVENGTIEILSMLLSMDVLKVRDESIVLQGVVDWVNNDPECRLQHVDALLELIRLDHVSTTELHRLMTENDWLNDHEQFVRRVNLALFHKLFTMMRVEPPVLIDPSNGCDSDVDDAINDIPASLTTYVVDSQRAITSDPRDDIEVFRGTVDLKSGWIQVAKKRDAIDVKALNKSVHLVGIGVNSGMKPGQHRATIQIVQSDRIVLERDFEWDGSDPESQLGYRRLMFRDHPIYVPTDTSVTISVLMKGPFTTQTNNGKDTVVVNSSTDDIVLQFSSSARDQNNTSVLKGQIPCIIIQ